MSLRAQAFADFKSIVGNGAEFGWPLVITPPAADPVEVVGLSNDISAAIDPDTGQLVSGRVVTVAIPIDTFSGTYPTNTPDATGKPWVVEFSDVAGVPYCFKVRETIPDRALGSLVLVLEAYKCPLPD